MCSGRVSSSCSTSGTRRVSLVTSDGSMRGFIVLYIVAVLLVVYEVPMSSMYCQCDS
jgi:hypothetical protein